MKHIMILFVMLVSTSIALPKEKVTYTAAGAVGHMPEVVVTVDRYEDEGKVSVGMLDTVVVTAPRVKVFAGRTAGQKLLFAGLIFLGALSLISLSWFVYQHYLPRKRRLQDCPC